MSELTLDLIDGNSAKLSEAGWEIVRIAIVKGLTGGSGDQKLLLAATSPGMPVIGDPHPSLTTAYLREITLASDTPEETRLKLLYRETEFEIPHIQLSGNAGQVDTNLGYLMWVESDGSVTPLSGSTFGPASISYTYPADYERNASMQGVTEQVGAVMDKIIPEPTISITRREAITGHYLISLMKKYIGTLNTGPWSLDPLATEGQWLCTDISGDSIDNGLTYLVTYSFQYRKDKWHKVVVFIDPETGKPPSDIVDNVGKNAYRVYEYENFNLLNLT